MGSKAFLVLLMFMATILLIFAEVAPTEYQNIDKKDGKHVQNGVSENKWRWRGPGYGGWGPGYGGWGPGYGGWGPGYGGWGPGYGGWGGPGYGGWGGPWRGGGWGGPWRRGWGGWRPNEHEN